MKTTPPPLDSPRDGSSNSLLGAVRQLVPPELNPRRLITGFKPRIPRRTAAPASTEHDLITIPRSRRASDSSKNVGGIAKSQRTPAHPQVAAVPEVKVPRQDVIPPPPATTQTSAGYSSRDQDISVRLYLREISETPLITVQEEAVLAKRIRKGDNAAREQMIKANLRLVVKIAHDFEGMGLPLLDMVNEGNMGLMRAVERFDPRKGAKLSTYAAWWIKQSIKRAIANQGKTIRVPVHLVDRIAKMRRVAAILQEELGREPSDAELAEAMGMTRRRVTELWAASHRPTSLDAPMGEDDEATLAEKVKDERMLTADEDVVQRQTHGMVRQFIRQLDQREATIIRYRFGLDGGPERTLEEVGIKFGVTRERIRQIQNAALEKLKRCIEKEEAERTPDGSDWPHLPVAA